ncbi:MAG: polyisoprenoid-binding protein [Alphaproteobacteria bacterium]|nr:MAG: polyisoprenoid-binding protein [Alphaproteobacteria bacterium]
MRRRGILILCFVLGGCAGIERGIAVLTHAPSLDPARAPAGTYHADPAHTTIQFGVGHLGYSTYLGRFDRVDAELGFSPKDPIASTLVVRIPVASVDSNNPAVDEALREELFDAAHHPDIVFRATRIEASGENRGRLIGDLAMGGRTNQVTLDVVFNGAAKNPLTGVPTMGFSATATIDRGRWGLAKWYPAVAREVAIRIEVEFVLEEDVD